MSFVNLNTLQDIDQFNNDNDIQDKQKVHIRIQSRTTRKSILTISGLEDDLDLKRILRYLKKNLKCNGAVIHDKNYGNVIQLQGDHRESVKQFLIDMSICLEGQIIVHGV
tara:strand:+ start:641 stop:970 length:330 start_codon:yes stop_codon:yes gene_type:complete